MVRLFYADIEADGLLDTATRAWCISVYDGETLHHYGPDEIYQGLSFLNTADVLVMHNGIGYDIPLLRKLYAWEYRGKLVDTLVMSRVLRPSQPAHSVEYYGKQYGVPKPEHEDWSRYSKEMEHRCSMDVRIQYRIYRDLLEETKKGNWKQALAMSHKCAEIFQLQEEYGWLLNEEQVLRLYNFTDRNIDRIDRVVVPRLPLVLEVQQQKEQGEWGYVKKPFLKSGGYAAITERWADDAGIDLSTRIVGGPFTRITHRPINLGSNNEAKDYLLSAGWVPREWNYSKQTGERTSPKLKHDEPFEGVDGKEGRLVARRAQLRHRGSLALGLLRDMDEHGRIHQRITGMTTTGRLKHGAIVNIPGNEAFIGGMVRKCFIAKPGYKIVGCDAAGCQNRMLAARVGDPNFTRILLEGNKKDKTSIHYVNMNAIEKAAGWRPSYKISKNLNYAFMFGAKDPKLASTAGLPENKGALIRKGLLSVSPGLERLVNDLTEEWTRNARRVKTRWGHRYEDGWIIGLDGRPIHIAKEHTILVFMLQSDEAILMQYALCLLYKWLNQLGWVHGREYGFVANIHDEYQAEVREDLAERYAELAKLAIVKAGEHLGIGCPQEGDADIGNNWYETH